MVNWTGWWSTRPKEAKTRRVKAMAWFGLTVGLLVAAVLTIGGGAAGGVALARIQHESATAVGTVTKTGMCGKATTDGTATFIVAGNTYGARAACNAHIGDPVHVNYDPTDPTHNK